MARPTTPAHLRASELADLVDAVVSEVVAVTPEPFAERPWRREPTRTRTGDLLDDGRRTQMAFVTHRSEARLEVAEAERVLALARDRLVTAGFSDVERGRANEQHLGWYEQSVTEPTTEDRIDLHVRLPSPWYEPCLWFATTVMPRPVD
jgi:hypothetical protein